MLTKELLTDMSEKTYTREEVFAEVVKYFKGDELAANVWINKYALKDSDGNLYEKTPDDMHDRIASEIARIENKYPNPLTKEEIFDVLKNFKYIVPQGGPMAGIGNNKQVVSLSNCFVIGNEHDSYGAILRTDEEQVQLMKRRGGVGHDLSHVRPSGSPVKNSALTSTGLVPFMERYSNTTREVAQDGRRGALMISCSIKHPDSESFMDAKMEQGKVTGANVSLKISDSFMESVKTGEAFYQQYPVDSDNPIIEKEVDAKKIYDKIIHNAWKSAEPGILFWDTIIDESIPDCYADQGFKTVSTNPCGEIPLCPYDSCRLLAINLYSYVNNPFTDEASFDFELFGKHVQIAQRIMDDIIDLELEKIDQIIDKLMNDPEPDNIKVIERNLWENIKSMALKGRRTGVGVTAEGDMIAALGLTYGTPEATEFSVEVHKNLAINAYKSSCYLGLDRGSFEVFDAEKEKNNPMIKRLSEADSELAELLKLGRRNIALLTIAPTGTVSLMTQTTSGIEPAFLVAYKRRRKINPNDKDVRVDFVDENGDSWEEYAVFHPKFLKWLKVKGYNVDEVKLYSQNDLQKLVELSPYFGATSNDVDWVEKVKMQGRVQKWVDHSISVTVNLPEDISEEIVAKVYMAAWESGCKGITVYREGSRSGVLVSDKKEEKKSVDEIIKESNAPKRPKKLECDILRFQNNHEKWIGFIGLYGKDKQPYEIFTGMLDSFSVPHYVEKGWIVKEKDNGVSRYDFVYIDKDGYEQVMKGLNRAFNPLYWTVAKLVSGLLRHGMPIPIIYNLLDSLNLGEENTITSGKNGIKRMFKKFIKDGTEVSGHKCPECGNEKLKFQDGCVSCDCGWSKCS
jgi:ribonucleoside-diphosphate reductase alpha chain